MFRAARETRKFGIGVDSDQGMVSASNDQNKAELSDITVKIDELKAKIVSGKIVVHDENTNMQEWVKTLK